MQHNPFCVPTPKLLRSTVHHISLTVPQSIISEFPIMYNICLAYNVIRQLVLVLFQYLGVTMLVFYKN